MKDFEKQMKDSLTKRKVAITEFEYQYGFNSTYACHTKHNIYMLPPGYATWANKEDKEFKLYLGSDFPSCDAAVGKITRLALEVIPRLIDSGVPEEVALKLLPHEIYELVCKKD